MQPCFLMIERTSCKSISPECKLFRRGLFSSISLCGNYTARSNKKTYQRVDSLERARSYLTACVSGNALMNAPPFCCHFG